MNNSERVDGGPAFPGLWQDTFSGKVSTAPSGMSLRDYFAAQVLPSVYHAGVGLGMTQEGMAGECYEIADAMLAERRKA